MLHICCEKWENKLEKRVQNVCIICLLGYFLVAKNRLLDDIQASGPFLTPLQSFMSKPASCCVSMSRFIHFEEKRRLHYPHWSYAEKLQ